MKGIITLTAVLLPQLSFADRYGVHDEEYGSGSGGALEQLVGVIGLSLAVIYSYKYLFRSYKEWLQRRRTKDKPEPVEGVADWFFALIGYAFWAVLLITPISITVKWFAGSEALRETLLFMYIPIFIVCTTLRRT